MANEHELKTIVLRDLEPLLRNSIDERLIVDNFTTESLLPPGENYGSTILSVHAVVRKNEDAPKEDLFLIAKMSPPTDYQKRIFDSAYTFRKETHMYVDILPAYNKFEIECGIKEDEVFDILPKFYGMRLSLDPDSDLDDDAVILLENLKKKGYYIGKRAIGYDYEHSKIAVQAMARFHALGIAMKKNRPEIFEVLKGYSKCLEIKGNDFDNLLDMMLVRIQEDPLLKPYYERCNQLVNDISMKDVWLGNENDPWCTITHADFWVNNIMFHRGKDGKVDDIKFVDFQNYLLICPLRELIFYLYTSGDEEVQKNHIDEFIDLYHDCFIGHLRRYGCDTTEFTKEKMNERIRGDARLEYVRVAFITKILTLNVQETKFEYTETKDIMINYQGYDYEHTKLAIQAMARFHALGMGVKYKRPEIFKVFIKYSKCLSLQNNEFETMNDSMKATMKEDPMISPLYERCEKILDGISTEEVWTGTPDEPWSTITHADFWVNNIMFHRGEDGRVNNIKFVDFQNYLFASPLRELVFFLFSSGDEDVQTNHIDKFINMYYECFIGHLKRFDCDTTPFSREKFDEQMKVDAQNEFMHLAFMMKVLTLNAEETNFNYDDMKDLVVGYQGNPLFLKRLRSFVLSFADRNWI